MFETKWQRQWLLSLGLRLITKVRYGILAPTSLPFTSQVTFLPHAQKRLKADNHWTLFRRDPWDDDSGRGGGGAKTPVLPIRVVYHKSQKQMLTPHNEAPCRKKNCKYFENWLSNRNFCSTYENSENFLKYFIPNLNI